MSYDAYANQAKIEELFSCWESNQKYQIKSFTKDGIVDPAEYTEPRVLFVLRDMNCSEPCDLCHELKTHGSGWKTWNNVSRWAKALLDGCEKYPKEVNRVPLLRRVAVMNLKKESGSARAVKKELREAVESQHSEILKEIQLCDPAIIICCGFGNASLLHEYVFKNDATDWREDLLSQTFKRKWFYYKANVNEKAVPVVSFCHPQVTNLEGCHGHGDLFEPLYRDMLHIKRFFEV